MHCGPSAVHTCAEVKLRPPRPLSTEKGPACGAEKSPLVAAWTFTGSSRAVRTKPTSLSRPHTACVTDSAVRTRGQ